MINLVREKEGARLILLDFANCLICYTRKKVTYELLTHEYNLREQRAKVRACTRPWRLPR